MFFRDAERPIARTRRFMLCTHVHMRTCVSVYRLVQNTAAYRHNAACRTEFVVFRTRRRRRSPLTQTADDDHDLRVQTHRG